MNSWISENFINLFLFLVDDTHVDARQCHMNNTIKVYVILNYPKYLKAKSADLTRLCFVFTALISLMGFPKFQDKEVFCLFFLDYLLNFSSLIKILWEISS